ncbi:adenylate/guanylate cyclase domain-containing protein [soil metagenome]
MTAERGHWLLRFFREARRRKVYTSAVAYVAVSLVLLQVGEALFQTLHIPVGYSILTILLILGFPLVLVLAWIFDIGAGGIHRTSQASQEAAAAVPEAAPVRRGRGPAAAVAAQPVVVQRGTAPPAESRREPAAALEASPQHPPQAPDPERVRRAALAHVRHELKTPIGAIIGYSEMLLEDISASTPAAADLRSIRQAGHELLDLVENILDADRSGGEARAVASYSERIRAALRDPITAVIGYAELLLEAGEADGAAQLAPDLERIRAAATRLLELSTDIVQVATGTAANAQFGESSAMTHTVLSKLRPIDAAAAEERQGVLLVVDDNPLNRDLLSRQLARKGYEVATADNGTAALQLLEEQSFDLVLLDILMPGIDGVEVLRRIRQQVRLADMPVIMTSSLDEIDSVIRCLEIGAADYVTKPFDPTLLDARIGACLLLRAARARESYFREQLAERDAALQRAVSAAVPRAVAERAHSASAFVVDAADAAVLWCDLKRLLHGEARSDATVAADRMRRAVGILNAAAARHDVEVVTLHGGGLLLAAGLPTPCDDAADRIAAVAIESLAALSGEDGLDALRFGLHSGVLNGTLLDEHRLAYHVWGDAAELAERLEQRAEAGTVHVSSAAHACLRDRFQFSARGVLEISGRQMRTYTLVTHALQTSG